MTVWLVELHYNYDGSEVLGVYSTKFLAQSKVIEELSKRQDANHFVQQKELIWKSSFSSYIIHETELDK